VGVKGAAALNPTACRTCSFYLLIGSNHQANSASYPQQDGKWVLARVVKICWRGS